jgi:hypothetical protein
MCISRKEMQSGAGNKCGSGLWPNESQKINWKQKSASTTPGRRRIFFTYTHKKVRCSSSRSTATDCSRANSSSPELQIGSHKKTPGIADRSSAQYPSLKMQESIRKRRIASQKRALGLLRARNPCAFLLTQHTTQSLTLTHTHTQTLINPIC